MVGQVYIQYLTYQICDKNMFRFVSVENWFGGGGIQGLQTTAYPTWNNNERHYYLEVKDKIS